MLIPPCGPTLQKAVRAYVALLFLALAAIGIHLARVGRNWPLGDWMINYEGGFVRRGLIGQLCLAAGRALHTDPIDIAVLIALACYAVVFFAVWRLLARSPWNWWVLLLLVSPCTFLFPVLSSRAGYHKEALYFAGLAALILMLDPVRRRGRAGSIFLTLYLSVACVTLILSHEPLAAYLPYYLAVLLIGLPRRRVLRIGILPGILSVVAVIAVLAHTGTPQHVQAICASINADAQHPCSEAITFLAAKKEGSQAMVLENARTFHYFRIFPILLILSLIPVVGGMRALYRDPALRSAVRNILFEAFLAALASLQLFRYGSDWGRWIQIHVLSLFLVLLFIETRQATAQPTSQAAPTPTGWRLVSVALVLVYATCWSVPGYGDTPLFGYISLAASPAHPQIAH